MYDIQEPEHDEEETELTGDEIVSKAIGPKKSTGAKNSFAGKKSAVTKNSGLKKAACSTFSDPGL